MEFAALTNVPALITVWLEIRILPAPPRTPIRTECSGDSSISPPIGGSCAGTWSPVPGAWFWLAFSPLLSLGSANPFLARASRLLQAGSDQPIRPSIAVWRDHSTGASRRRVTPMPRGNRPSIAAFTRSGARKARDIVMLTWRTLHPSRLAMRSTSAFASSTSSLSQRRPRAIDAIKVARVSDRIGRTWWAGRRQAGASRGAA